MLVLQALAVAGIFSTLVEGKFVFPLNTQWLWIGANKEFDLPFVLVLQAHTTQVITPEMQIVDGESVFQQLSNFSLILQVIKFHSIQPLWIII